jgi:hypothetical protein
MNFKIAIRLLLVVALPPLFVFNTVQIFVAFRNADKMSCTFFSLLSAYVFSVLFREFRSLYHSCLYIDLLVKEDRRAIVVLPRKANKYELDMLFLNEEATQKYKKEAEKIDA